jgi:hypothetical protein
MMLRSGVLTLHRAYPARSGSHTSLIVWIAGHSAHKLDAPPDDLIAMLQRGEPVGARLELPDSL